MTAQEKDALVLARLRERGPGTITVKQLAVMTGLTRIAVRTSATMLAAEGVVCLLADAAEVTFRICHLHAEAGECEQPLIVDIQEVHPDGQR